MPLSCLPEPKGQATFILHQLISPKALCVQNDKQQHNPTLLQVKLTPTIGDMERPISKVVGVVDESGAVVCAYRKDENKDESWRAVVSILEVHPPCLTRWSAMATDQIYFVIASKEVIEQLCKGSLRCLPACRLSAQRYPGLQAIPDLCE